MQKKLIALAVAGLASSGAFAQMNVTLYGNIDLTMQYASGTSRGTGKQAAATETGVGISGIGTAAEVVRGAQTAMISGNRSTSKVGFKGTEDLGSGLKLDFVVESGFDASGGTGQAAPAASGTSGAGILANREGSLALSGNYGKVKFGSFKHLMLDSFGQFDAASANTGPGSVGWLTYDPITSKANNSIAYITPNMGGFVGTYQVAMSENQDRVNATISGTISSVMLNYTAGPVVVQIGQSIARDYASNPLAATLDFRGKKFVMNHLGGSYDFGVAKLMGQYFTTKNSVGASTVAGTAVETDATINAVTWNMGVSVPVGAHVFYANYVSTNDKRANDMDASSWFLGYDYNLSKRTTFYSGIAVVSNKNGAMFAANTDNSGLMAGTVDGSYANIATTAANAVTGRTNAVIGGFIHKF